MKIYDDDLKVPWICDKCDRELEFDKTNILYMDANFQVDLLKCPECGIVYIDEELARGKILEVEKALEDK